MPQSLNSIAEIPIMKCICLTSTERKLSFEQCRQQLKNELTLLRTLHDGTQTPGSEKSEKDFHYLFDVLLKTWLIQRP